MENFQFHHLRASANHNRELVTALSGADLPVWGVFTGLFGMATNEVYLVVTEDCDDAVVGLGFDVLRSEAWHPTARPTSPDRLNSPGLYVFRRFHIRQEDVAELVSLSEAAWETFEHGADYASRPVGLFEPPGTNGEVPMQLVTWYDGFESWEKSRTPAPQATENFRRRHTLTSTSYAVATRLVTG
ncbi:MAG: hypothetical protein AAF541_18370 [Pseudomonadota bacterium]